MRKTFILVLLNYIYLSFVVQGQNLVPNPGFEDLKSCPGTFGEVSKLEFWENYHYTPDLFHECATSERLKTPVNFFGIQAPASGKGYAGITAYHAKAPNEIIGVKLLKPLKKGVKYEARIKVSLAEKYSKYGVNKLGFLFTNEPHKAYNGKKVHVKTTDIISETKEWVTIGGTFIPDKDYSYMMIGNFFDRESTDRLELQPTVKYPAAYYYIDDVYVAKQGSRMSFSSSTSLKVGDIYRLDNVLFDFNKAVLKPFSIKELKKLLKMLKGNPKMQIRVSGHTDSVGSEQDNLDLSLQRAKAVVTYLTTKGGIEATRLVAKGFGETKPVTSNSTEPGRALNRRVEFTVLRK